MKGEVKLLKAMGEETRMKILLYLMDGERCACTIAPSTGKSQPTVSQHLKILTEAGILNMRKNGSRIMYSIKSDKALRILEILEMEGNKTAKKR